SRGTRKMNFKKSTELRKRSHGIIPGGAHTYAKGDDQYPENSPGFLVRGEGCHVWDMDGNEFIEYGMGLRSVTLGHGYKPVIDAAYRQMQMGINFTRPSPIEVECAEKLASFITSAEMVKFGKNGSDATSAALKLARAYTGRDLVAICAEQPFFSVDDWFIGSTEMPGGIPQAVRDMTVKFHYNDIESIKTLFTQYPGQIACLIMEAERTEPPVGNFLHQTMELCHQNGALFILDEIITGFRWDLGGAQRIYRIQPDLSAFGKAMANGFSISALVGKKEFMEAGGIYHDRERVFLLSLTFGAEAHSLAAALETMKIYENNPVIEHLQRQGERLTKGINQAVEANHLQGYFGVDGRACNLIYNTRDENKQPSQPFRTLFLQEIIKQGIIAPSLVVSYSHTDQDIDQTVDAIANALQVYAKALDEGVEKYLVGKSVKPVMRKYC
ncbi:MAG: glutamate-1-semialdehyde 2,1-aminomutase, partial [Anaerolineales bacterium]